MHIRLFRHLGVVGIDVPLEHIEREVRHSLWGTVYAFMVDTDDASAILHPFTRPSAQVSLMCVPDV